MKPSDPRNQTHLSKTRIASSASKKHQNRKERTDISTQKENSILSAVCIY